MTSQVASSNTVWFITGANKGLGLALTRLLVSKPHTTVIAASRSRSDVLQCLEPSGTNSELILTILDVTSPVSEFADMAADLVADHGVDHIDVLFSNAGSSPPFLPISETSPADLLSALQTNTLGPLKLYQSLLSLLNKSSHPKFIVVSSVLASIGGMDKEPNGAYGVSKAAVNFVVRKLHVENEGLVTLALHPGFVGTDMGRAFAGALGVGDGFGFPVTEEESVRGMAAVVETTNRQGSGRFLDYKGKEIPW